MSAEQISGSRTFQGFIQVPKSFEKAAALSPAAVGDGTSLTFVFSFVPDVGPTPGLGHHSHLEQRTSRIDEGAEFPTRKEKDSVFQELGERCIKTIKIISNYCYIGNHNEQRKHPRF